MRKYAKTFSLWLLSVAMLYSVPAVAQEAKSNAATRPTTQPRDAVKMKMHALQTGEPAADGWVKAHSTEGKYSVELPGRYNDFTVTGPTKKGNPGFAYVVGNNIQGKGKYSVSRIVGDEVVLETAARETLEGLAKQNHPVSVVKKIERNGQIGFETSLSNATSSASMRCFLYENSIILMIIECPANAPAITLDVNRFFDSISIDAKESRIEKKAEP